MKTAEGVLVTRHLARAADVSVRQAWHGTVVLDSAQTLVRATASALVS